MPLFVPDFTKLWSKTYLFGPAGFELSRSDKGFFFTAVVLIAAGLIFKFVQISREQGSPARLLLARFFHLFFTIGVFLLIWSGAREQGIPWVSTHFLALLLGVVFLVWLAFILRYYFGKHRSLTESWAEEKIKKKYLVR